MKQKGFTLLELLIVIGVITILAIVVVIVLNPLEALREARDSERITKLEFLKKEISIAKLEKTGLAVAPLNMCAGESDPRIFVSIPNEEVMPAPPSGWNWFQVPKSSLYRTNGTGWLPIDFTQVNIIGIEKLPVDPVNTIEGNHYYAYTCDRSNGFELNVAMESTNYRGKLHTNDGGDAATRFEIGTLLTISPAVESTFTQSAYRWFTNIDDTNVGTALAANNTAITDVAASTTLRLRMLLHVDSQDAAATSATFRLQYATRSGICDTSFSGESYTDLLTSSGNIRFANNPTPADGDTLTLNGEDPTHLGHTVITQKYEETNDTDNTSLIAINQDGEWDFTLINFSAPDSTGYCFRLLKINGGAPVNLNAYSVIPEFTTAAGVASTTSLANGTDPGNSTLAPGAAINDLDSFTFQTDSGSDSVTALTVALGAGTSSSLSEARITSDNGSTTYFTAIANPSSDTVSFSGGTPIPVSTSAIQFKVRITPKSHAAMPSPPGSSYALNGTVTTFTSTNQQAGSDSSSATLTIDNASPANVSGTGGSTDDAQVTLNWTNPGDSDFTQTVILRRASVAVGDTPSEGTTYAEDNPVGSSTVACVINSPTATCLDAGLTNGTAYHYKIFAKDTRGNYSTGVVPTGSPFTPQGQQIMTLVPNGDFDTGWLITNSATRWDALNDAVVCGSGTGSEADGYINSNTNSAIQTLDLTEPATVSSASGIDLYIEALTATDEDISVELLVNGINSGGSTTHSVATAYGWWQHTVNGTWTQSDVNSMQLKITNIKVGGGPMAVQRIRVSCANLTYIP